MPTTPIADEARRARFSFVNENEPAEPEQARPSKAPRARRRPLYG